MSNVDRSILSIIEPTIKVDPLYFEDKESPEAEENTSKNVPEGTNTKDTSRFGAYMPYIAVNSNKFESSEIENMRLVVDKVPKIYVSLVDYDGKFDISAPLDGDVISVYIRPPDVKNQKPIRIDFDVEIIKSDAEDKSYFFVGTMKIPEWTAEGITGFSNNTSFEHLSEVASTLGLGFASNESLTEDSQPRIRDWITHEEFVEHVVAQTYKDEESFFDWYIDPFYYLCLVNVNKQFSLEDTTEDVNVSNNQPTDGMEGQTDAESGDVKKGSLVLTNEASKSSENVFISSYSMENNSGSIWRNYGYKHYGSWYDASLQEYEEAFVDPFTTPGAESNFILLKGRPGEETYKLHNKYTWLGKQSIFENDGNMHANFHWARVLNFMNLQEINKTTLKVKMKGMNFYIYKYMRIPVVIYQGGDTKKQKQLQQRDDELGENVDNTEDQTSGVSKTTGENVTDPTKPEESPTSQVKNEFLSGYYVVKDIEYSYEDGEPITQNLTLVRREWPIPAKNKTV